MRKLLRIFEVTTLFMSILSCFVFAEDITITTYYPSPYGVYREMRAQRMAIGENYIDHSVVCWEGDTNCNGSGGQIMIPSANDVDLIVKGNVGIGTTGPGAKLSVVPAGSNITDGFRVYRDAANDQYAAISEVGGSMNFLSKNNINGTRPQFSFYSGNNVDNQEIVTILGSGNVGIGTTSPPQAKLHIGGTAGTDGIMFPDGTLQTTAAGRMTIVGGRVFPTGTPWTSYDVSDADLVFLTFSVNVHANSGQYWLEKKTDGWYLSGNAIGGTYRGFQKLGTSTAIFTLTWYSGLYDIKMQIININTFSFLTYAGATSEVSITKFAFR